MKYLLNVIIKFIKKGNSFNHRIFCSVLLFFISVFLLLHLQELLLAETAGKVLILNSDMSIANYSLAHTGFKSKLTTTKDEIDLGSKWIDEAKIGDTIHDIDPDVIYCIGSKAYLMAYKLAENKNLIFSSLVNWRRFPMGKNTYGIATELLPSMQLTIYRYFFPEINKIGVLYNKDYNKEWLDIAVKDAKDVRINIIGKSINKQDEIESALQGLLTKVDALWLIPDPVVMSKIESVEHIFNQSDKTGKPVFAYSEAFVDSGATFIISADILTTGIQAAGLAIEILSDQKSTKKVQTPAGSHITLNLKMIEKYKIKLNMESLDSVNQIIK